MNPITHFTTRGNSVIGIEDAGLVEQGYANEPLHLICLCYGVPGMGETGAEVAEMIAGLLNSQIRKEEK
jgi:hypothetical protein